MPIAQLRKWVGMLERAVLGLDLYARRVLGPNESPTLPPTQQYPY